MAAEPVPGPTRYGGFRAGLDCEHCGRPVDLAAPAQTARCEHCRRETRVPEGLWRDLLEGFDDAFTEFGDEAPHARSWPHGTGRLRGEATCTRPRCAGCGEPLAEGARAGEVRCARCGEPTTVTAAPGWLRAIVGTAAWVFTPGRVGADAAALGSFREAPDKPVVMPCPRCGASIDTTRASPRVVTCAGCATEVYLPEDLWQRLHPAASRTAPAFYIGFEGPTAREQREAHRAAVDSTRDHEIDALVARGRAAVVRAAAAMIAVAAWAWLAPLVPALSALAGPVGYVLATLAVLLALSALVAAGRPISRRTGYGADFMVGQVWLVGVLALVIPGMQLVVGAMGLWRLSRTSIGGFQTSGEGGANPRWYPEVPLTRGEAKPLGAFFLVEALLWPVALVSLWVLETR